MIQHKGRVVYPWSLYQKIGFVRNTFVPLLDAAEQVFIIIVLFSFLLFFFLSCREVFLFSSPKLHKGSMRERKKKKFSWKRVQRTIQGLEPVLIFGNVRIKSPFTTTKKEGENGRRKKSCLSVSLSGGNFRWSKTPECCFPFFIFHVIFPPPPSVIFSTVSNLRGVQLLTGSR